MASNPKPTCQYGVPLESHRRCAACRVLMGCVGEVQCGRNPLLCEACEGMGAVVVIGASKPKRLKRPSEVAAEVGISRATVLRMIRAGELEATVMRPRSASGKGVRHLVSDAAIAKAFGLKQPR